MPTGIYEHKKGIGGLKGRSGVYVRTAKHLKQLRLNSFGKEGALNQKQTAETIEKRVAHFRNENHWGWKGDKAGYRAIHIWVEKRLGKPNFCQNCGNKNLKHRQYQWANIGHTYKRLLSDWRRLCCKCHKAYDRANEKNY